MKKVYTWLNNKEFEKVKKRAKARGISIYEYFKSLILTDLDRDYD